MQCLPVNCFAILCRVSNTENCVVIIGIGSIIVEDGIVASAESSKEMRKFSDDLVSQIPMFNTSTYTYYSPSSCTMFSCIDGTFVTIISSTSVSEVLVEVVGGVILFEVVGMDDWPFTKSCKEMK